MLCCAVKLGRPHGRPEVPDDDVISSTGPRGDWRASEAMPEKRGTLVSLWEGPGSKVRSCVAKEQVDSRETQARMLPFGALPPPATPSE